MKALKNVEQINEVTDLVTVAWTHIVVVNDRCRIAKFLLNACK